MDTSILDKAIVFAVKAHQGAERKGKAFPYIVHPMEAVSIAATMTNDQELLAAAVLHDTVEDSSVTLKDIERDILKAAVFERHHDTGHIGIGFISGYGIKRGAIATSVAHDSHNLIVAGCSEEDIAAAAEAVREMGGGLVVVENGKVIESLPLPIAGLMSPLPIEEVENRLNQLKAAAKRLGASDDIDPFMTLAFVSLPVIPVLRLNGKGLIDVNRQKIVEATF